MAFVQTVPFRSSCRFRFLAAFMLVFLTLCSVSRVFAADSSDPSAHKKADQAPPDVIVFTNGDQLSGKFLREVGGTIAFHSDIVGEVNVKWDKIKELRTSSRLIVIDKAISVNPKKLPPRLPEGKITVADQQLSVRTENNATIAQIPVKNAQFIMDEATFAKQLRKSPGILDAWNGSITAGATVVQATQDQYTFNGAVGISRTVPSAPWLNTRNRTTADFSGSYGKITQPAYTTSDGTYVAATYTKSAIYHADAERDQYFSPRFYALAQTAFDHNYSQGLDLQQIYGGGIGWTAIKRPKQQLDLKATLQYERQEFISSASGTNQDLIGSTFAGTYLLKLPRNVVVSQQVSYLPAYNNPYAYSATEVNTVAIPFYKDLSFSVGTNDSYLNNPVEAEPPTKRNSFQFTFGATYTVRSKY